MMETMMIDDGMEGLRMVVVRGWCGGGCFDGRGRERGW